MIIGVPREIKTREYRVGLIPAGAKAFIGAGHKVFVEKGAGESAGIRQTCRPTTHANPSYEVSGVLHYCVANMPGAVPRTSTFALTNTTRPYGRKIADPDRRHQGRPGHRARPQHLRRPRHLRGRGPRLRLPLRADRRRVDRRAQESAQEGGLTADKSTLPLRTTLRRILWFRALDLHLASAQPMHKLKYLWVGPRFTSLRG